MRGEEVRQVFETLEEGKCMRVCNLPWALSCTGIWLALRELTKQLRDPPAAFTRGQTQSLTVLQFLVDDYDQLSFGLAVRGPCVARAAAAVDEVFADVHRWARHRDGGLARQGVLLVQQRWLVLPRPNVGSWHHVHSHADHKNEDSVCGPVLWVQPVWDTWEQESGVNHINIQSPHSALCSGMVEKCLGWGEEPESRARCMSSFPYEEVLGEQVEICYLKSYFMFYFLSKARCYIKKMDYMATTGLNCMFKKKSAGLHFLVDIN